MIIRRTLFPLYSLPVLLGISLCLTGCGTSPDDIIIAGDSNIPSMQLTSLTNYGEPVLIGIGSTYKITWVLTGDLESPVVKIYLQDPTDESLIEITPTEGISADSGEYNFTPSKGLARTGYTYDVVAKLYAGGNIFDTRTANQGVRIGEGGINITTPSTSMTLARGLPLVATWTLTNNICQDLQDKVKYVHLYIDTVPNYRDGTSILITEEDEDVDACLGTYTIKTGEIQGLQLNTPYYIIGRLYIDGVEASRNASPGTFQTTASITVTAPINEIISNFQAVPVAWEVIGRSAAGLKVEFLAKVAGETDTVDRVVSSEYSAEQGTGLADASKLPPGTYTIAVRLFERDAKGAKVILDTGTSSGRIIIPNGYLGSYDLSEMAAVKTRNYSPVDGVIFEGYNINDMVGFEVAGVGDINGDTFSDFMIFSRYQQQYTTGNAGGAFLIHGQESFTSPIVNVNSIGSPDQQTRLVDGTIMLLPLENLATMNPSTGIPYGKYTAIGLPDISNDKKGDILIGCPDAAPLDIIYTNLTTGDVTVTDHFRQTRIIPVGYSSSEPAHVHPWFDITGPEGSSTITYTLTLNSSQTDLAYLPGDIIHVEVRPGPHTVVYTEHPRNKRGTTYLLTSQRLNAEEYINDVYDLAKVGSPVEDGNSDAPNPNADGRTIWFNFGGTMGDPSRPEMCTWTHFDENYGEAISVMGDIQGDGYPELLISIPKSTGYDTADISGTSTPRIGSGRVKFLNGIYRHTSISTAVGNIAWIWPSGDVNGPPFYTDGVNWDLDIIGAQTGSRVTGAAGLGRFKDTANFGVEYINSDFNGDQIPDMVVGAPGEDSDKGAIYVIGFRKIMGRRSLLIDLADMNVEIPVTGDPTLQVPIIGIKVLGTVAGEQLGQIVKPAGDFNGDGLADVMFSTPNASAGDRVQAGRVFIMFGQEDQIGDFTIEDVDSHLGTQLPALIFEGQNTGDHFGTRIVAVYDVNDDGLDDILVAAPDADAPTKTDCGKIYLIYGKKGIIKTDPRLPAGINKFVDYDGDGEPDEFWNVQKIGTELPGSVFIGEAANCHLQAISPAGDVNGDTIGDFIIGAPNTDINRVRTNAGKAYLIFGRKYVLPN